jgi:hypothetical protein
MRILFGFLPLIFGAHQVICHAQVIDGQQQIPLIYSAVFIESSAPAMAALRERYLHRSFHDADLVLQL